MDNYHNDTILWAIWLGGDSVWFSMIFKKKDENFGDKNSVMNEIFILSGSNVFLNMQHSYDFRDKNIVGKGVRQHESLSSTILSSYLSFMDSFLASTGDWWRCRGNFAAKKFVDKNSETSICLRTIFAKPTFCFRLLSKKY